MALRNEGTATHNARIDAENERIALNQKHSAMRASAHLQATQLMCQASVQMKQMEVNLMPLRMAEVQKLIDPANKRASARSLMMLRENHGIDRRNVPL